MMLNVQQLKRLIQEAKLILLQLDQMGFGFIGVKNAQIFLRFEDLVNKFDPAEPLKLQHEVLILTAKDDELRLLNRIIYTLNEDMRYLPGMLLGPILTAIKMRCPKFIFKIQKEGALPALNLSDQWMHWQHINAKVVSYRKHVHHLDEINYKAICFDALKTDCDRSIIRIHIILWMHHYLQSSKRLSVHERRLIFDILTALTLDDAKSSYCQWYHRAVALNGRVHVWRYNGERFEIHSPSSPLGHLIELLCYKFDENYPNYRIFRRHGVRHTMARIVNGPSWDSFKNVTGVDVPKRLLPQTQHPVARPDDLPFARCVTEVSKGALVMSTARCRLQAQPQKPPTKKKQKVQEIEMAVMSPRAKTMH